MRLAASLITVLFFSLAFAAPAPDLPKGGVFNKAPADSLIPLLFSVLEQIHREYVRPIDRTDLLHAALASLYEEARLPVPAWLRPEIRRVTKALGDRGAEVDEGVPTEPAVDDVKTLVRRVLADLQANDRAPHRREPPADPFRQPQENTLDGEGPATRAHQMMVTCARGMARLLDAHSGVITAEEYRRHAGDDDEGDRFGLDLRDNIVVGPALVDIVQPGGPAQRTGIRPGDILTHLDGKPVDDVLDARNKLRLQAIKRTLRPLAPRIQEQATPPKPLAITFRRPGQNKAVTVELLAEPFHTETVFGLIRNDDNTWNCWIDKPRGLAYVRLGALAKGTGGELATMVGNLQDDGLRGLLLDLRWSPGGYLLEATEAASLFLGEVPLATVKARSQPDKPFLSAGNGKFTEFPIVAIVNGETSGGAELIAAALQDHNRARLAGQRTRGKGSIQTRVDLGLEGIGLKLTTGTFYRPNGKALHRFPDSKMTDDWGVRPDIGLDFHTSADLNRQLAQWYQLQALRPGGSRERLPLDDPQTDPTYLNALAGLRDLVKKNAPRK